MKIIISDKGKKIRIAFPTMLINAPTLRFILRKGKIDIDDKLNVVLPKLCRAIRHFHRHNRRFVLIEVITKENEHIKITL